MIMYLNDDHKLILTFYTTRSISCFNIGKIFGSIFEFLRLVVKEVTSDDIKTLYPLGYLPLFYVNIHV